MHLSLLEEALIVFSVTPLILLEAKLFTVLRLLLGFLHLQKKKPFLLNFLALAHISQLVCDNLCCCQKSCTDAHSIAKMCIRPPYREQKKKFCPLRSASRSLGLSLENEDPSSFVLIKVPLAWPDFPAKYSVG